MNKNILAVNRAIQSAEAAGFITDADRRQMSYREGDNAILVVDEDLVDLGSFFDKLLAAGTINAASRTILVRYEQSRQLKKGELVLFASSR